MSRDTTALKKKAIKCVDIDSVDKRHENFKNKGLMRKQREIVDKFFLSAQDRV